MRVLYMQPYRRYRFLCSASACDMQIRFFVAYFSGSGCNGKHIALRILIKLKKVTTNE